MLSLSPSSVVIIVLLALCSLSGAFNYYEIGKVATLTSKVTELENTAKEAVESKEKVSESCKQDDKAVKGLVEINRSTDTNTKSLQDQLEELSKPTKPKQPTPLVVTPSVETPNEISINSKLPSDLIKLLDKAYQDNR
jgi:biopolymer transport protein ExbB/TolQ